MVKAIRQQYVMCVNITFHSNNIHHTHAEQVQLTWTKTKEKPPPQRETKRKTRIRWEVRPTLYSVTIKLVI